MGIRADPPGAVWYDDAKLGIFIHWGLYSVPGWAPRVPDIQQLLIHDGPKRMLRESPYAEWYRNSMQIKGSPTQRVPRRRPTARTTPTTTSSRTFDDASSGADLDAIADLCQAAGARYVVLTTKHHDGFALWPSAVPHPVKGEYHARRDLVGDLTEAVRARRMRMGLYYSGGYDWPYNDAVLSTAADAVLAAPQGPRYVEYVTAHYRELIDRYRPSVLWNDIAWPKDPRLPELFAHYYNTVEEGVINDRWREPGLARNEVTDAVVRGAGAALQALWPLIPERRKHLTFATPEALRLPHARVRGPAHRHGAQVGAGAGRRALVRRQPSRASPRTSSRRRTSSSASATWCRRTATSSSAWARGPTGPSPRLQQAPLRGLGAWLDVNAEAIYGSRPWVVTESATGDGTPLRFTKSGEGVYALVMGMPPGAAHHPAGDRRRAGAAGAPGRGRRAARLRGRERW